MPRHDKSKCSPQELRFVDAYVGEAAGIASHAAKAAGYSGGSKGDSWKVRGSELLDRKRVRDAIAKRQAEVAELERQANELARSEKLAELVKKRADALIGPTATAADLQRYWSAVAFGEIEGFTGSEKLRASEFLARSLGIFVHENEVAPAPVASEGGPRVQVNVMIVDNGRGPLPPSRPVIAGDEPRKALKP